MIKIAICDDEKKELETVYALLTDAAQDLGIVCRCSLFESGEKLLDEIENGHTVYDIALLDIYMKELSGIRTAEQLAGLCPETAVVFITTSQEHAVDAFTLEALHYLVKPVDAGQLRTVLERYLKKTTRKKTVEIRVGRDNVRLSEESIQYLESARNGTDIHTAGGLLHTSMPTGLLEQKLGKDFLKIQRGLIVNMHFIEKMTAESCALKNGFIALLSRRDRQKIRTAYREFIFNVTEGSEDS